MQHHSYFIFMTNKTKFYCLVFISCFITTTVFTQVPRLTKKEQRQGWQLLFDGTSSKGWQKSNGQPFPQKGWVMNDGVLSTDTTAGKGRGGDIVTEELFTNFELALEFKIVPGSNSGIKYFLLPKVLWDVNSRSWMMNATPMPNWASMAIANREVCTT